MLAEYARTSTSKPGTFTDTIKLAADVNKDDIIDARDASTILAYYVLSSTDSSVKSDDYFAQFQTKK